MIWSLLLVGTVSMLIIPDQRVHALYIVASHCILLLYQFQHPPDASESFETAQFRLVGYVHSFYWHLVWRLVQSGGCSISLVATFLWTWSTVWSTIQSLHSGYSLAETLETVDGCSLVPLACAWVSHCFCIVNRGAPSWHYLDFYPEEGGWLLTEYILVVNVLQGVLYK